MRIIPSQPLFVHNSDCNRWSRILMMQDGYYLECDLVPPFFDEGSSEWLSVEMISLRWQKFNGRLTDYITRLLPPLVKRTMSQNLPEDRIEDLLNSDLFSLIDWKLFQERSRDVTPITLDQVLI